MLACLVTCVRCAGLIDQTRTQAVVCGAVLEVKRPSHKPYVSAHGELTCCGDEAMWDVPYNVDVRIKLSMLVRICACVRVREWVYR